MRDSSRASAQGKLIHGSRFDKSNLRSILRSPIYVGRMSLRNETFAGAHEAMIEKSVWDAAQVALTRNGRRGGCDRPNRQGTLLRGLVLCGACGSTMRHTYSGNGSKRYLYYVCGRAIDEGASACQRSQVPVAKIEGFVLDRIRGLGNDTTLVRKTIDAARAERERRIPELEAEARCHEAEKRRVESERSNLVALVANAGPASGVMLQRVAEAATDAEQRAVIARDALVEAQAGEFDVDALRATLAEFDSVWNELFPRERARILALLIERVTFAGQTGDVAIHFRASGLRRSGVSYVVTGRFEIHRPRPAMRKPMPRPRNAPRRDDRTARMLGLALRIEQEIERGTIRDMSHATALLDLSPARMTQLMNLLHLAPDIQARLLGGDTIIPERALRLALRSADWDEQRIALQARR